jgi:hypothetical protein
MARNIGAAAAAAQVQPAQVAQEEGFNEEAGHFEEQIRGLNGERFPLPNDAAAVVGNPAANPVVLQQQNQGNQQN